MGNMGSMGKFSPGRSSKKIQNWLAAQMRLSGRRTAVVGLSGGLDSSVAAGLAARALGARRVVGVIMPSANSSRASRTDALLAARRFKISHREISVAPMVAAYARRGWTKLRLGNFTARQRMAVLYDVAAQSNGLVLGTSNRTELLLGYFTKFGDGGADLEPLGGLYKRQVRSLARHIGVPGRIIGKPPTADLWPGQTDEGEIGMSYDDADEILRLLFDKKMKPAAAVRHGFAPSVVRRVIARNRAARHKLSVPPSCPV